MVVCKTVSEELVIEQCGDDKDMRLWYAYEEMVENG